MDDPILEKRLKNMFESRAGEHPVRIGWRKAEDPGECNMRRIERRGKLIMKKGLS